MQQQCLAVDRAQIAPLLHQSAPAECAEELPFKFILHITKIQLLRCGVAPSALRYYTHTCVHECVHFGNCANTAPSGNDRQIVHSATPWPGCACLAYLHLHQIISFPTPRWSTSGSRMRRKQPMCSTLNPAALGLSTQLWWSKSTLLYLYVHVQMNNIVII